MGNYLIFQRDEDLSLYYLWWQLDASIFAEKKTLQDFVFFQIEKLGESKSFRKEVKKEDLW